MAFDPVLCVRLRGPDGNPTTSCMPPNDNNHPTVWFEKLCGQQHATLFWISVCVAPGKWQNVVKGYQTSQKYDIHFSECSCDYEMGVPRQGLDQGVCALLIHSRQSNSGIAISAKKCLVDLENLCSACCIFQLRRVTCRYHLGFRSILWTYVAHSEYASQQRFTVGAACCKQTS